MNKDLKKQLKEGAIKRRQRDLILSEEFIQEIKEAEREIKRGDASPTFDNVEDAIKWLDDKDRKYKNQI
ncbi:MAG: hypothetical protein WAW15_03190 [Minisyncoccales bacterium]